MKNVRLLLLSLGIILFLSYSAAAQLTFDCDFNQDGVYGSSWIAFPGQEVTAEVFVSDVPIPGLWNMGFFMDYNNDVLDLNSDNILRDTDNWPYGSQPSDSDGRAEVYGFRC